MAEINKMIQFIQRLALTILGIGLTVALASCGGSGGSSSGGSSDNIEGKGTVGILLTDKPADPSLFSSINASIESIALLGSEDGGKIELYSGPTKTFDLLRLRNESIPFSFKDNVPSGRYCKIRLILSDLELVLADDTPEDLTDNETYHPHLPGNGKLDLLARDCFHVGAGEIVTLQLDIDAGNSIHIVGNNKGYNVRPVVFIDVLKQGFDGKLVRLHGSIAKIDEDQQKFLLCHAIPTQYMNTRGCVDVHLGDDSAFFDNQDFMGAPRPLSELLSEDEDRIGQEVTVVGWPRHWVKPHFDFEVSEGHYPPPGECKLWDINLEPGQQSEPIDCDVVPDDLPVDIVVITHEGVHDLYHPLMVIDGLVVELGEFVRVEGEVAASADANGFSMNVATADPVITDSMLDVMLQQGGDDFNGTRIVSKSGKLVDFSAILASRPVQVDGTMEAITSVEQMLKAALVIVDTDYRGARQLTGTVLDFNGSDSLLLEPDVDSVCGDTNDMLTVELAENLEMLTVTITDDGSKIVPGGDLAIGQSVGMNGVCQASGYYTDNVVIVDEQRTFPP